LEDLLVILVVEDDPQIQWLVEEYLRKAALRPLSPPRGKRL
jgi:DNA-binding response OmpR family regulator